MRPRDTYAEYEAARQAEEAAWEAFRKEPVQSDRSPQLLDEWVTAVARSDRAWCKAQAEDFVESRRQGESTHPS